jgi:hypothetical protein
MWCAKCQADVAAEVSSDNQRVFCTSCGTLLSTIEPPPERPADQRMDRTRDARELLQRWSRRTWSDPFGPLPDATVSPKDKPSPSRSSIGDQQVPVATKAIDGVVSMSIEERRSAAMSPSSKTSVPPESSPPSTDLLARAALPSPLLTESAPIASEALKPALPLLSNPLADPLPNEAAPVANSQNPLATKSAEPAPASAPLENPLAALETALPFFRVDASHPAEHFSGAKPTGPQPFDAAGPFASRPGATTASVAPKPAQPLWQLPHWDPLIWRSELNSSNSWTTTAGQFLAYAGVLGLTAGACLVMWSYFNGPAHYAPTGWLLATAGQMLLFFGIVTLVSGGLEQTTEQVNKRIEQLGDHLLRIEQAARQLNSGTVVPSAHFTNDSSTSASAENPHQATNAR